MSPQSPNNTTANTDVTVIGACSANSARITLAMFGADIKNRSHFASNKAL